MGIRSILFAGSALIVASALAINQPLAGERGDGRKEAEGGIPLPAGQFSFTSQGSFAICLDPSTFAQEPCTTGGALVLPLTVLENGASVFDESGNSCTTYTQVDTDLPADASPPSVTANIHIAGKPLDYDSSTEWAITPLQATRVAHVTAQPSIVAVQWKSIVPPGTSL